MKIKCTIFLLAAAAGAFCFASCSDSRRGGKVITTTKSVSDILNEQIKKEDEKRLGDASQFGVQGLDEKAFVPDTFGDEDILNLPEPGTGSDPRMVDGKYPNIDIDLTTHSSIMVYAEVFDMMVYPDNFVGKVIKMNGKMYVYDDVEENRRYYSCVVMDATACCAQGIEFILPQGARDRDYPKDGEDIVVTGVFKMYESHGFDSFRLENVILG